MMPTIAVIVPAFNAAHHLERALPPLAELLAEGTVDELIVVDDRSTDQTPHIAAKHGARVLTMERNGGPGAARNFAATQTTCDILWFVDADVMAHKSGPAHIRAALTDPSVWAVFGSYDDVPPVRNFASQYKNLTHRYYHQRARDEASTFWAGCGAVRRQAFLDIGGFDAARYRVPSIEDIELGQRLRRAGGRILLLRDLLGTHLKAWTLRNVVEVDLFRRAVPWSRLLVRSERLPDDLNVSTAERLRAGLAGLFFLAWPVWVLSPGLWWLPLVMTAAVFIANLDFFRYMRQRNGVLFGIASLLFHQLYYVYSACAFVFCAIERRLFPENGR